jgi:hypothetical protein
MKIVNGILDTIAVLICLAGLGMIGFVLWFVSLFTDFSVWDFVGLAAVAAFVIWRFWRWDRGL